jgi:prepilin-type N-terminal cleavage/methylation domain-containing protein
MWKTPSPSRPSPLCSSRPLRAAGFTLVELLVAMTVLVLIVVLFAQVIASTSASIVGSSNGMDMDQAASIALDRIGNTIRNMVTSGSGTLVVIKNLGNSGSTIASDGLVMLANQRVRNRPTNGLNGSTYYDVNVTTPTNVRMGAFGYLVMNTLVSGSSSTTAPMLNWGDGTIAYAMQSGTPPPSPAPIQYMQANPAQALLSAAMDISNQMASSALITPTMLQFSPVSPTILRFEVCCLLSDGTIASGIQGSNGKPLALLNGWSGTTLLPRNKYFVTGEAFTTPPVSFASPEFPLAFNTLDSDTAPDTTSNGQNVYVQAIIVGIASLDTNTQKLLASSQVQVLTGPSVLAKADGQTPLATWDISSPTSQTAVTNRSNLSATGPNHFPAAVLQNIRFSQRYYYVN